MRRLIYYMLKCNGYNSIWKKLKGKKKRGRIIALERKISRSKARSTVCPVAKSRTK
jgi:hypothetical protein